MHNVCVSSVVRFRSRVLSPTQNIERRYKLWITPHRTIEETFCWALGRVNRYLIHDLSQVVRNFSLTSPSPPLKERWVLYSFAFFKSSNIKCRGAIKLWSDHALSAGNICRPDVFLILRHRLPVGTQVCEVKRWFVSRVPSTETRPAPGAQREYLRSSGASEAASCPRHRTH